MENSENTIIDLSRVGKRFATPDGDIVALAETSLAIRRGEFVVLLGPSGCGKTTLLRLMAGLTQPSSGTVLVRGRSLWSDGSRQPSGTSDMGVVFQDASLFPWFSIEKNIALPLKIRGVSKEDRHARAHDLCRLVGISGFEQRWPSELSGGMRQRAAIARALSHDPTVLLMDEPFGALDAMTRDAMNVELQRIWLETSKTVVLVTHSIPEAVFLADRIVLLTSRPGRIEKVTEVTFPRPRELGVQSSAAFQSIVSDLRNRLD